MKTERIFLRMKSSYSCNIKYYKKNYHKFRYILKAAFPASGLAACLHISVTTLDIQEWSMTSCYMKPRRESHNEIIGDSLIDLVGQFTDTILFHLETFEHRIHALDYS